MIHFFLSSQVFGILCTLAAERILGSTGDDRIANSVLALVLLLGSGLTALIKPDYRRQAAAKTEAVDNAEVPLA